MTFARQFRLALADAILEPLIMPSVFDALSAQLVARAGFKAAWLGGSGITNTLFGLPDVGYINLTDMDYVLKRAVAASSIPLLADLDGGYGSIPSVINAIRLVEASGAAGAQIDDQIGHQTPGSGVIPVIPADEIVGKIKAAVDSRKDRDFFIVARTDALSSEGISAAIERVNRFTEVGADAAYISGVYTKETMEIFHRDTTIHHRMLTRIPDEMPLMNMRQLGFDMVALGQSDLLRSAVLGMSRYLDQLKNGKLAAHEDFRREIAGTSIGDWAKFTGLESALKLAKDFKIPGIK